MRLINTGWVPLAIATLFGLIHPSPPLWDFWPTEMGKEAVLWYLALAPLGEELLFRGLLFAVAWKLTRGRNLTDTNPMPVAVWATALAFSVWHAQNLSSDPFGFVAFQVFYTFFVGLWLGYVRWKSGKLWLPIGFHVGLNLCANLL